MKSKILKFIFIALNSLLLTSCVGDFLKPPEDPTKFYILRAPLQVERIDGLSNTQLNVAPVRIPEYLMRQQIVTQAHNRSEIHLSDYNRWLEFPSDSFSRIVSVSLSRIMRNENVYLYPFVSTDENAPTLRVMIIDCVGELGGKMYFKARWEIANMNGSKTAGKVNKLFAKAYDCGDSYESYIQTIDLALYELSFDVASGLKNFENQTKSSQK